MKTNFSMYLLLLISLNLIIGCDDDLMLVQENSAPEKRKIGIEKANYYIAPNGDDSNPGTIDRPFKNWDRILSVAKPGDLIYVRGGVYYPTNKNKGSGIYFRNLSGEPGKYIRFWAYPGEEPVLDCSNMTPYGGGTGLRLTVNYWHIKGIQVKNVKQGIDPITNLGTVNHGINLRNASHNILEEVVSHHNDGIGLSISLSSTENQIRNCDIYKNYDPLTIHNGSPYPGGHADGVHITVIKGTKNYFKGCRFFNNSDDGIDMWEAEGVVHMDSCWAFNNGYGKGDGNGFKYGQTLEPYEDITKRYTAHCLAYNNIAMGFDQNNANVKMEFYNNFAFKNQGKGFYISKYNLKNIFINNISFRNGDDRGFVTAESVNVHNSWNGIYVSDADFISTNMIGIDGPRKSNGNLPDVKFLLPSENSNIKDKGIYVGFPFNGRSPDLGIFESQ